jgi:hypothetical protein
MGWEGPFRLRDLLDRPGGADSNAFLGKRAPRLGGIYVFSSKLWKGRPKGLLYIGSAHSTEHTTLRHRIGAEVIAALGFSGGTGGVLLSKYCRENGINPLDLYVAWQILESCPVPDELRLFDLQKAKLSPELLYRRPPPSRCGWCR